MAQMFTQLVAKAGFEPAVGLSLYLAIALAFVLAIVAKIGWTALRATIRHRRVARELKWVRDAAYRERPERGSYVA
jgi:hypothetical protein